jgi:glycosyltransferase involved in cell wall biosynthesis
LLGLSLYGPRAASHRYRLAQYASGLASCGIELKVQSLLDDVYLRSRFAAGPVPIGNVLRSAWERIAALWNVHNYDLAMVHCELLPFAPSWFEAALLSKPYIYDFDDAFHIKYRTGPMSSLKYILGDKIDNTISRAAAITAGNEHLAEYARMKNGMTWVLPTVVDTLRYRQRERHVGKEYTIGWIGSPSTSVYLSKLIEPLSSLGKECLIRLVTVGGRPPYIPNVITETVDWDEATEIDQIHRFDVGVMPLPDDEWARGKCAFKLIQYMACGIPVVASPVGANVDVVNDGCGRLAKSSDEWISSLRMLRNEPELRLEMGQAGRKRVEERYSLTRTLPLLTDIVKRVYQQPNQARK